MPAEINLTMTTHLSKQNHLVGETGDRVGVMGEDRIGKGGGV